MHTKIKRHRSAKEFRPRLTTLLRNINLSGYIKKLPGAEAEKRRQRYKPQSVLKALMLRQINDWSYRRLAEELRDSATLARACGFEAGVIPHYSYFCHFFRKLEPELIKKLCTKLLRRLAKVLPIPRDVVAVDSAPYKAYANSFTKRADPEAGTGKSSCKGWYYGYKLHAVADVSTELMVALEITPGNVYDGHHIIPVLEKARDNLPGPFYAVLGDKGYDAGYVYVDIVERFRAFPIIPIRGESKPEYFQQLALDDFLACVSSRTKPAPDTPREKRAQRLRHDPPLPRDTELHRRLERLRPAIERHFSRFEQFFCPPRLRVRGLRRAECWFLLGWFLQLASALFLVSRGHPELIRSFPYRY